MNLEVETLETEFICDPTHRDPQEQRTRYRSTNQDNLSFDWRDARARELANSLNHRELTLRDDLSNATVHLKVSDHLEVIFVAIQTAVITI